MNSLPNEVKLDVLKFLDFEQLFSVKQTNFYFLNLINDYEGGLARMKFNDISIRGVMAVLFPCDFNFYRVIKLEIGVSDFTLNKQLKTKWQKAIAESISLYLDEYEFEVDLAVYMEYGTGDNKSTYVLQLPNFPKNIEEMKIIRFWLEQLFKCAFGIVEFYEIIFNPKMINLLFDGDKTIIPQFCVQKSMISPIDDSFENNLNFALNHLAITESLSIDFKDVENADIEILMNILIDQGNKLPLVCLINLPRIYDLIIDHITTSTDCSKMVPVINLYCLDSATFKLNERAENVEIKQFNDLKITKFQIANIYNPKVKFSFCHTEYVSTFEVSIKRM